jgi:hypothetical protein
LTRASASAAAAAACAFLFGARLSRGGIALALCAGLGRGDLLFLLRARFGGGGFFLFRAQPFGLALPGRFLLLPLLGVNRVLDLAQLVERLGMRRIDRQRRRDQRPRLQQLAAACLRRCALEDLGDLFLAANRFLGRRLALHRLLEEIREPRRAGAVRLTCSRISIASTNC